MQPKYDNICVAGGDTAQPLALGKRLDYIKRFLVPGRTRFLDCGCGAGAYVFELVDQLGLDASGVEYDSAKVEAAKLHPRHGHRISQGDLQELEVGSCEWDYVMLNEVLEHIPDESAALNEVHRILTDGGLLFVFSPNRWFPFETHGVHLKHSRRRVPHWVPFIPYIPLVLGNRIFDYWARNYWQEELKQLVSSAGFSIIETGFVWQTFENISGRQPKVMSAIKPVLRAIANTLEALPLVSRFGVSQVLVCRKQSRDAE